MKTIFRTICLLLATAVLPLSLTAENTFRVCALNVDGLPSSILGININPDSKGAAGAHAIGQKLATMGYDIVGVSEDFNYHSEIVSSLSDWQIGTYRGGILSGGGNYNLNVSFDTDGLNLFARSGRAQFREESWTGWNDKSGKFSNGADELIDKGFRHYVVTFCDSVEVDVYILHMDAETDDGSQAARASNIRQLTAAVCAGQGKRPIIIMGDTNCRYNRDRLKQLMIDPLNADPRFTAIDAWVEHERDSVYPDYVAEADASQSLSVSELGYQKGEVVDKVIYVNSTEAPYHISANYYLQDISFVNEQGEPLADHWPVVVEFTYWQKAVLSHERTDITPAEVAWVGENPTAGGEYYIYHPDSRTFLTISDAALHAAATPSFVWQMTSVSVKGSTYTMQMQGAGYWFNLAKSSLSAKPNLSQSQQTIELTASTTTAGAYKLHRTASPARYLNYNGGDYTGAQSQSVQNDWIFISPETYRDSVGHTDYQLPDLSDRHPNPLTPGVPTAVEQHAAPRDRNIYIRNGRIMVRHRQQVYRL